MDTTYAVMGSIGMAQMGMVAYVVGLDMIVAAYTGMAYVVMAHTRSTHYGPHKYGYTALYSYRTYTYGPL